MLVVGGDRVKYQDSMSAAVEGAGPQNYARYDKRMIRGDG
jgi:hypothetical protein